MQKVRNSEGEGGSSCGIQPCLVSEHEMLPVLSESEHEMLPVPCDSPESEPDTNRSIDNVDSSTPPRARKSNDSLKQTHGLSIPG